MGHWKRILVGVDDSPASRKQDSYDHQLLGPTPSILYSLGGGFLLGLDVLGMSICLLGCAPAEFAGALFQGAGQLGYALGSEEQQDDAQQDDQFHRPYLAESEDRVGLLLERCFARSLTSLCGRPRLA